MVTKLNSSVPATAGSSNTGGVVVGLILAAVAAWATYEFWWKPKKEAEQAEEKPKEFAINENA